MYLPIQLNNEVGGVAEEIHHIVYLRYRMLPPEAKPAQAVLAQCFPQNRLCGGLSLAQMTRNVAHRFRCHLSHALLAPFPMRGKGRGWGPAPFPMRGKGWGWGPE